MVFNTPEAGVTDPFKLVASAAMVFNTPEAGVTDPFKLVASAGATGPFFSRVSDVTGFRESSRCSALRAVLDSTSALKLSVLFSLVFVLTCM